MGLCINCGLQLRGDLCLCPHHHSIFGDDFALNNRALCNLIHRGIEEKFPEHKFEQNQYDWNDIFCLSCGRTKMAPVHILER